MRARILLLLLADAVPPGLRAGGAALLLALLLGAARPAQAVPPGTAILNVAQADYRVGALAQTSSSNPALVTTTIRRSDSVLSFWRYAAGGELLAVPACAYSLAGAAGPFVPQAPPILPPEQPWQAGGELPLRRADIVHSGESVFALVVDPDQNLDALVAETVLLRLGSGDRAGEELLRLTETEPASGRFLGWLHTGAAAADPPGDGALSLGENGHLLADYTDAADPADRSAEGALVDPVGRVFDSTTGALISGARLRLETAAGVPAAPLGDDGESAFPATLVSGESARDAGGRVYAFSPGSYRYPLLPAGEYRLVVEPPAGYLAPSRAAPAAFAALPGAPFAVDSLASRGEPFVLAGAATFLADLPLDPVRAELFLVLRADRDRARRGECLVYTLEVTNQAGDPLADLRLALHLPPGLRALPGSARLDGARAAGLAPSDDGRRVELAVGALAPGVTRRLALIVELGPAARTGSVRSRAEARATGAAAVAAEAALVVEEDPLAERSRLAGRVLRTAEGNAPLPLAGVRLLLEDGRQVITDAAGRYHLDDLAPGAHHLRVDPASLPAAPLAGCALSRLVDLAAGSLWQEDFQLALTAPVAEAAPPLARREAPRPPQVDAAWLAAQDSALAWLWPLPDAHPEVPSSAVVVKHPAAWQLALSLNGEPVPALSAEASLVDEAQRVALSRWTGIDLRPGDNRFELVARDAAGRTLAALERRLHYSGPPVRATLVEAESALWANGRDPIRVVLRLEDAAGHPARRGVTGPWRVGAPYRALALEAELARQALAPAGGEPAYRVDDDGRVELLLAPSSVAGEALVHLPLGRDEETLRLWLRPEPRDWIVVGLAEGSAAYRAIAGHAEHIEGGETVHEGRLALYAKGRVRGEWLLTAGFDTDRETGRLIDGEPVDPEAWYPIYGDASTAGQDAASARKLYLRLEGRHFAALVGDYDTGLAAGRLARYERRLTGAKGEWRAEGGSLLVFGAEADTRHGHEELRGGGHSGPYLLAARDLLPASERVVLETRDRRHAERVLARATQRRDEDYTLAPAGGVLRFKSPVPVVDADFNPVFIVVDYESPRDGARLRQAGGRAALALPGRESELGLSLVHEDDPLAPATLEALDLTLGLPRGLRLSGELARSDGGEDDPERAGGAGRLELEQRRLGRQVRLHYSDVRPGFGLGQQLLAERASRRGGLELRQELSRGLAVDLDAGRERSLEAGAGTLTDFGEASLRARRGPWAGGLGLRLRREESAAAGEREESRLLLDAERTLLAGRLRLRAAREQRLRGEEPHRNLAGATLPLGARARLEAGGEWQPRGPFRAHLGLAAEPWPGGSLESGLHAGGDAAAGRHLHALLGLRQRWRPRPGWSCDAGLERARPLRGEPGAAEDFDALSLGAAHSRERWSFTGRGEWRQDRAGRLLGLEAGAFGEPRPGLGLSLQLRGRHAGLAPATGSALPARSLELRLGYARRPAGGAWLLLERLECRVEEERGSAERRLLWQGNANLRSGAQQLSLFHGLLWNTARLLDQRVTGAVESLALEWRRALRGPWDCGLRAGLEYAERGRQLEELIGASLGRRLGDALWLQAGFNASGFRDGRFPEAGATAAGLFASFALRFDEEDLRDVLRR